MIDAGSIEALSRMLDVKKRVIEADIKELAWLWGKAVNEARFADVFLAFHVLRAVVRSYLRGRNLRMGNSQGIDRHGWTEAYIMAVLVKYVSEDTFFHGLHRAGVTSVKAFTTTLNERFDRLLEANRKLKEGENNEGR